MKGILSIQSHVVFGHAGNSSAVFPIQRMGLEVWPIHTVQFSNHTQYPQGFTGKSFDSNDISTLIQGLNNIGQLAECQAIISGYQGSAEQCLAVADAVKQIKQQNQAALYVCDPVMGDPKKGCIVSDGVAEQLIQNLMPIADVIVPNQFELTAFTGMEIHSLDEAIAACNKALELGPKVVLVKHLHSISDEMFSSILATEEGCYLIQRPELPFDKAPVGVGDLISGIFTACLVKGLSPLEAFSHTNNAVYGVMEVTKAHGEWELMTVLGQDEIVNPTHSFATDKIA
ncbi:pyridoxal kinase PdxY [Vibrio sp. CDRSL-10 TSBA]